MSHEGTLWDATARRYYGLPERVGRAKLEELSATAKAVDLGGWTTTDITPSTTADQTPIAPGRRVSDVVRGGRRIARFVSEAPIREAFSVQSARYAEKRRRHAARGAPPSASAVHGPGTIAGAGPVAATPCDEVPTDTIV